MDFGRRRMLRTAMSLVVGGFADSGVLDLGRTC